MGELGELRGEAWRRLLAAARRRLERTGGEAAGSIGLTDPTDEEMRVVARIAGRPYGGERPRRVTVRMAELDGALRRAYGAGLLPALARLDAPDEPAGIAAALQAALRGRHSGEGWYAAWLGRLTRDGTAARLVREGDGALFGLAAAVLDRLPGRDLPLPVLAEWATGDAAALFGTPLADLVLRALRLWQGAAPGAGRAAEAAIWADAGVVADDLASQVLVLGLRLRDEHPLAGRLEEAASAGLPTRLTLHELMAGSPVPDAGRLFVCQSAQVTRAAAARLGSGCAPLVCTEGPVSVACRRLLTAAVDGGTRVRWRTDFDWPGLRSTAAATHRYAAVPWHMDADDYLAAVSAAGESLTGPPAASPWDPRLAAEMARAHRAVREERLLPALLADLGATG